MTHDIIRFDAEGDVILATVQSSYLLVSSRRLREASPVFRRLLEDFEPGSTATIVKAHGFQAPALQFTCAVIHGKDPSLWHPTSPLELYHLAVACRYEFECAERTDWLVKILFEGLAFGSTAVEDIVDLLATAFVCKLEPAFQQLSKLLVYEASSPLIQLVARESGACLGKRRLETMELERLKLQQKLLEIVPSLLLPTRCGNTSCTLAGHEAGGLIKELYRINLWPLTISEMGVGEALRRLGNFREPDISVVLRKMEGWFSGCEHPHALRFFSEDIAMIRQTMSNVYGGYAVLRELEGPSPSIHAVQLEVRTPTGFQGHFRLNGCLSVEMFFELAEGRIAHSGKTMDFDTIFVELPWAIGLLKALRIDRGDSDAFEALLKRISEAVMESDNEDAVYIANICPSTNPIET